MPEFQQLLAQVFERRGYSVAFGSALTGKTGTSYEVPLLARSGGLSLAVHWKTDAPLTAQEATAFSGALDDLGLSGGVLVAWGGADPAAAGAAPGKIEVWNPARVAAEVGDAIIHAALAPTSPAGPVPMTGAPAAAQPVPVAPAPVAQPVAVQPTAAPAATPARHPSFLARATSAASGGGDAILVTGRRRPDPAPATSSKPLGYAWGGVGVPSGLVPTSKGAIEIPNRPRRGSPDPSPVSPVAPGFGAPAAVHAPPSAAKIKPPQGPMDLSPRPTGLPALAGSFPTPAGTQVLIPVVAKDAALGLATPVVGDVRASRFALVPHVAFDYDVNFSHEYFEKPLVAKGTMLVNAITGEVHNVAPAQFGDNLPEPAEVMPAKLSAVDVYDSVKKKLTKTLTKEVSISKEIDGNEISDTKKIVPGLDDLNLNHRGIVMVPTWVCQGEKGTAQVDAANALVEGPPAPPPTPPGKASRSKDKGAEILKK